MALSHNQQILLTRQRHEAEKMGLHWDYRIVVGGKAYSWATKKELPEPGKAILLHEQPIHTAHYALSERVVIPSGQYGGGVTTLDWVRKGVIKNAEESKDKFVIEVSNGERFLLKRMPQYSDKAWLFKNLTKAKPEVGNKYLEKIAIFRAARKPHGKWSKEEFQGRFTEMFDKAVNKKQLDADKVKNYRWKNAIGTAGKDGQLARLLVPSKTEPGKHLELKHASYKK